MASVDDKVETGVKQLANASHYQVSRTYTNLLEHIETYWTKQAHVFSGVCAVQGAQQGMLSDGCCGDYCCCAHGRPSHTTQELMREIACI